MVSAQKMTENFQSSAAISHSVCFFFKAFTVDPVPFRQLHCIEIWRICHNCAINKLWAHGDGVRARVREHEHRSTMSFENVHFYVSVSMVAHVEVHANHETWLRYLWLCTKQWTISRYSFVIAHHNQTKAYSWCECSSLLRCHKFSCCTLMKTML